MLSAFIWSEHSYPAMPLAGQPVHQRFVQLGPLVLESKPLKSPTPTADRDRTVSRRSEPRSRTALMGEQPNPWDLLQPQDATIRHRAFLHDYSWRRLYLHPAQHVLSEGPACDGVRLICSYPSSDAISPFAIGSRMDQSLRGQGLAARLPT